MLHVTSYFLNEDSLHATYELVVVGVSVSLVAYGGLVSFCRGVQHIS